MRARLAHALGARASGVPEGKPRARTVPAYTASAAVYDRMVGRYAYEHWRENFERLEKRHGFDISLAADVACGTGLASRYLAERGADVCAFDLSPQMLAAAARATRGLRVRLLRQDMRYLSPPHAVTAIICATDSLNYLLREEDIRRALGSFYAALLPDGYVLFDLNTAWQLREGADTEPWELEIDGRRMRWRSRWDEDGLIATLEMIFPASQADGDEVVETHRERAYAAGWVLDELAKAGFRSAEVFDAAGLGKAGERTRRLQFVARR